MRIALDARCLASGRTGMGKYLEGLLGGIARLDTRHEFLLCTNVPIEIELPNDRWRIRAVTRGLPYLTTLLWLEDCGRQVARRDAIDAFWGPSFLLPLTLPARTATLLTVLDLVLTDWRRTWKSTGKLRSAVIQGLLFPPSLRRADGVLTISETVAREIEHELAVPRERMTIAPPGVGAGFRPLEAARARRELARAHGLDGDYVLTIGTRLDPRKNLATLLRAYGRLPRELRASAPLVVLGAGPAHASALHAVASELVAEKSVRFLGYVPDGDVPLLYAGAKLFAFPTLYEGFGMPLAEAMACGTPAVASDIAVLREVGGEVPRYVPPLDVEAWTRALVALLADQASRDRLGREGPARARLFSFDRSAAIVIECLERLVHARSGASNRR